MRLGGTAWKERCEGVSWRASSLLLLLRLGWLCEGAMLLGGYGTLFELNDCWLLSFGWNGCSSGPLSSPATTGPRDDDDNDAGECDDDDDGVMEVTGAKESGLIARKVQPNWFNRSTNSTAPARYKGAHTTEGRAWILFCTSLAVILLSDARRSRTHLFSSGESENFVKANACPGTSSTERMLSSQLSPWKRLNSCRAFCADTWKAMSRELHRRERRCILLSFHGMANTKESMIDMCMIYACEYVCNWRILMHKTTCKVVYASDRRFGRGEHVRKRIIRQRIFCLTSMLNALSSIKYPPQALPRNCCSPGKPWSYCASWLRLLRHSHSFCLLCHSSFYYYLLYQTWDYYWSLYWNCYCSWSYTFSHLGCVRLGWSVSPIGIHSCTNDREGSYLPCHRWYDPV